MDSLPENTLRIRSVKHLASALDITSDVLLALADRAPSFYRSFEREVKGKRRLLVEATGPLKRIQRRVLDNVLVRLRPSPVSFGGVKGRTIKDNATVHARSAYAAKMDIRDFYPSIHSTRVYGFFCKDQGCSPDVAHILTALTTRDYSLPLGTSTSPALADQIVRRIDVRISGLAARAGLKYTRYVDDITLSGPFSLQRLTGTAARILRQSGFRIKTSKLVLYGPDDNWVVTGAAIEGGRITAPIDYVRTLAHELRDLAEQSRHSTSAGSFLPREHYRGKIAYIKWLDPHRGQRLLRLYKRVSWRHLEWMRQQLEP